MKDGSTTADAVDDGIGDGSAPVARLDLLFVVDNSAFMAEKQALLADATKKFLHETFATDIHVGVITSTVGTAGTFCTRTGEDDKAHLINRSSQKPGASTVPGAEAGFLSFGPQGTTSDLDTLADRTAALIRGADQFGCGVEAPLEALYRFLAHPDPPLTETFDPTTSLPLASGVDYALLAQRKAFLRPDSKVAIVLVTDEDDSSIDLFAGGGLGYSLLTFDFPGSKVQRGASSGGGTTAARGTSICANSPSSPDCASCALGSSCDPSDALCQKIRSDSACKSAPGAESGAGYDGFYAPADDVLNVRTFDMKRRFGLDPHYPVARYVAALGAASLPDRASEHPESKVAGKRIIGEYVQATSCSNPLFSDGLPEKDGDELCHLGPGSRSPNDVVFGVLAGVAGPDLIPAPDWTKLLGKDPESFDTTGIDPHMLPSLEPRMGLSGADLPVGDNGTDPVNGREWRTMKGDLEFACSFELPTGTDCTVSVTACECGAPSSNPPVCGGPNNHTQVRGRATPGVRELLVAKALGDNAVVGSVCGLAVGYDAFLAAVSGKLRAH